MFRRLLRYGVLMIVAAGLLIGIKACSNPPTPQANTPQQSTVSTQASGNKPKININTAILSELDKLEAQLGVPALSHKIQSSRPYGSIDDLVSKQVVSQAQFDQIKAQVTTEEIVLTGVAKDIDYMTKLGLMKGHMLVASELLELNQPAQAEPHIGHPVEEIYVDLEEQFQERNVPEFKGVLTEVQDLVKSKPNSPEIQPKFAAALAGIDRAIAALPADQRQSATFVMPVINGMLETATAEYTAAITNGKVSEAIEYQDSRGFVLYAQDTLYKTIADQVSKTAPDVNTQLTTAFSELKTAWPSPLPPATPVMSADQVASKVKQIEQASQPVLHAAAL